MTPNFGGLQSIACHGRIVVSPDRRIRQHGVTFVCVIEMAGRACATHVRDLTEAIRIAFRFK
jgi:mRNA-degrading endonuclease toxin of MazEF toxin-antitoxin module